MRWLSFLACIIILPACSQHSASSTNNPFSRFVKGDVDEVIEIHQQAVLRDLKALMVKLYKRNPNQRHDKETRTIIDSVDRSFTRPINYVYPEWHSTQSPVALIRLAFDEDFHGDRVLAYITGLRKMLMASYDDHSEFYYFTAVDQQKLYNSARNIETAAWLLAMKRNRQGQLLILSDSLLDESRNLSYQRLFGQMIATQDNLAEIMAKKNGRMIRTFVVQTASLVFLPI